MAIVIVPARMNTISQPLGLTGMAINMHPPPDSNPKNLPLYPGGTRGWSYPLFGCFSDFGTCLAATFCPCFLFSKINSRLNHLIYRGSPHPYGGDGRGHCISYSCTWCVGIPCIMQALQRTSIRDRYNIDGTVCGDYLTACCCHVCDLVQGSREIELEEGTFRRQIY